MERERLEFNQIAIGENPRYNTLSQEIKLPFSYGDYESSQQHQASLIHEYTHLVQASTTTHGIYNFIGLSERFVFFFDAIKGRAEIRVPFYEWAQSSESDKALQEYAKYEHHFRRQRAAGDGYWNIEHSETGDFALRKLPRKIAEHNLQRWHCVRRLGTKIVAVPLLAQSLCEAQAECVASYFQGIPSPILERTGKEITPDELFYTTIPGLLSSLLPHFSDSIHEAVYLLTDYALMTFAPDEAFVQGLDFLKTSKRPQTLGQWVDLRKALEARTQLEARSVPNLNEEIERKIRVYGKHQDNEVVSLFIQRLELGKRTLALRAKDAFHFFPWDRQIGTVTATMLSHVPIPHARFSDGIYALGSPAAESLRKQAALSAASFLFDALHENTFAGCPLKDDHVACPAERTIDCSQYPWGRGDVGGGQVCAQGMVGKILGIDSAHLIRHKT